MQQAHAGAAQTENLERKRQIQLLEKSKKDQILQNVITYSPKKTNTSKPSKRNEISTDYSESATAYMLKRQSSCKSITSYERSYVYDKKMTIDSPAGIPNFNFPEFNKMEELY